MTSKTASALETAKDVALAVTPVAGGIGGLILARRLLMPKKQREKVDAQIGREIRDPRLYSNIRHALKSQKERVRAHKNLDRRKDHTVWSAMKEGFGNKLSAVRWMRKPETGKFPDMSLPDRVKMLGGTFEKSMGIDRHDSVAHYKETVGKLSRHMYVLPDGTYIIDHRDEWNANKHPVRHMWHDVIGAFPKVIKEKVMGSSKKTAQIEPAVFAGFAQEMVDAHSKDYPSEVDGRDPNSPYRDSALNRALTYEQSRMNKAEAPPRQDFARANKLAGVVTSKLLNVAADQAKGHLQKKLTHRKKRVDHGT